MTQRTVALYSIALSILMLPCIGRAQGAEAGFGDGRFEFRIGGQAFTSYETRLRLDSERLGLGTEIRLEDELFVEDSLSIARLSGLDSILSLAAVAAA